MFREAQAGKGESRAQLLPEALTGQPSRTNAWFGLPEAQRGFIAGVSAMNLPRHLPYGVIADMMLAGERLSAQDALRHGFVQQVTSREDLLPEAMRRAEKMAKSSQSALWGTKLVLRYWRDLMLSEHYRYYESVAHRVLLSGDMLEGIKAFSEKRDADSQQRCTAPAASPAAHCCAVGKNEIILS